MNKLLSLLAIFLLTGMTIFSGEVPSVPTAIHYQGQLRENDTRYEGTGIFRFAIIDASIPSPVHLWTNDGSRIGEPAANIPISGVTLNVSKGLFNVALGDDALTNMTKIPLSVFSEHKIVSLRVWFQKDAGSTIELLSPDTRLFAVPYAFKAGSIDGKDIADVSIPMGKLARESVGPEHQGRSDTIKSIYFDIKTRNVSRIYDIPDDKTFVITDIFIMSSDIGPIWMITDDPSSQVSSHYKFAFDARGTPSLNNWSYSFKAGLRFVAPQVVAIFPIGDFGKDQEIRGTISGFEFDTPTP